MSLNFFSTSTQKLVKELREYSALEVRDFLLNNYLNNAKLINQYWKLIKPKIKVSFKNYQMHDLFNLFYANNVEDFFVNRRSAWSNFIRKLMRQEEYLKLRKYTVNNEELSALITSRIMNRLAEQYGKLNKGNNDKEEQNNVDEIKGELRNTLARAEEFANLKRDAEELMLMLGNSFSHESLSLLKYLQSPDAFRRRIRILRDAFTWLRNFNYELPASFRKSQLTSDNGEINNIEKLMRETQLTHMVSNEYSHLALANNNDLARLIFALRYINKELLIYRGSASPRISLYIDKSGSMGSDLEGVPRISLATGLGLAMLKKFDDTMVYMFDTEIVNVNKEKMVQTLLTMDADGGTDIAKVLGKIVEIDDRKTIHIIITDGVDEVNNDIINTINSELRRRIVFILIEANAPQWMRSFHYYPVRSIADFQRAVANSLKSQI